MERVVERIINLLAFLLTAGRPVTAEEIRNTVLGYDQEGDEAFRRMFERDKDLLRSLGVPIRMDHTDAWEVELGYVVAPDEYALPDPGLTDDERVALLLATRMVRLGGQAPGSGAILKLGGAPAAAGGEPFTAELEVDPAVLGEVYAAVVERRALSFGYQGSDRSVHPLGLVHRRGHWYLIAERAGGVRRTYRIDRMRDIRVSSEPDAFSRPRGFRAASAVPEAPWEVGEDRTSVTIRFDPTGAWWARRRLTEEAVVEAQEDGGITATFPVANPEALIGWLIDFEDGAELLEPEELRSRFVSHLGGTR